ncbi:ABC transporter permease [Fastidiosipila sanguinis]|uniref:ABC-2 type transporter transmembrane domain-containing protein n=1 Tax=Fastidiosipila sanguinis TaxID=236753 RepID=A0A2S0KPJ4_9FIRM|nr:ABC transporter permease [Fastidiosipila sanguinis]AVM42945.1 hypothetical protein C5Q98_06855 [Fastidiosipila sanguinis]
MRNIRNVFNFEFKNQIKKKSFWVSNIILILIILLLTSIPTISNFFSSNSAPEPGAGTEQNIADEGSELNVAQYGKYIVDGSVDSNILKSKFPFSVMQESKDFDQLKSEVLADEIPAAVVIKDRELEVVLKSETFQNNTEVYREGFIDALNNINLVEAGLDPEIVEAAMVDDVPITVTSLQKSANQNFFFSYLGVFVIYMMIMFYGSNVSSMVANEKSNRTMEILVTNTSATSLVWGKVSAGFVAALLQVLMLLGALLLGTTLNKNNYSEFVVMLLRNNLSVDVVLVFLAFALLGFLLYLFIFAACGAIVSKIEDLQKAIMPVTMLVVIGFVISMSSLQGSADNKILTIGSYVPFTSPYLMFVRYVSFGVSLVELLISLAILVLTIVLVAWICTKIYRNATLKYGNKPSLFSEFKKLFSKD